MAEPTHSGPAVYAAPTQPSGGAGAPQAPPPQLDPRSIGDLFRELAGETTTLLRQEVALAKTETTQKAKAVLGDAAMIVGGGLAALVGAIVLVFGLGYLLGDALDNIGLGLLLVGLIVAVVGGLLAKSGIAKFSEIHFGPERTIETLKEDKQWLQNEKRELTS